MDDRRETERLLLTIPIRVIAFGGSTGTFSEDTHTVEVNHAGARIALRHRVSPEDTLRIVNLENLHEADFRVIGPTRMVAGEVAEWGVECLEAARNIWGIEFSGPLSSHDPRAGALLECEECGRQSLCVLSMGEFNILESTGSIPKLCAQCGELTSWMHADVTRRPQESPPPEAAPSPVQADAGRGGVERRAHKRLGLKLPVLVCSKKGEQELAKTENISKGGLAVFLGMTLEVGEIVKVFCPYSEGGQNVEQKAEVRRRVMFYAGQRWLYGMRYLR